MRQPVPSWAGGLGCIAGQICGERRERGRLAPGLRSCHAPLLGAEPRCGGGVIRQAKAIAVSGAESPSFELSEQCGVEVSGEWPGLRRAPGGAVRCSAPVTRRLPSPGTLARCLLAQKLPPCWARQEKPARGLRGQRALGQGAYTLLSSRIFYPRYVLPGPQPSFCKEEHLPRFEVTLSKGWPLPWVPVCRGRAPARGSHC